MIVEELNLPPVKIHCSVLAEDAIKSAIEDYKREAVGARHAGDGVAGDGDRGPREVTQEIEDGHGRRGHHLERRRRRATSAAPDARPLAGIVSLSPKAIEAAKKQLAKRGTPEAAMRLGTHRAAAAPASRT